MRRLPQVLINVKGVDKSRVETTDEVQAAVAEAEQELGGAGRVLLRKSGTEPVVRVMVEADEAEQAQSWPSAWPRSSASTSRSGTAR